MGRYNNNTSRRPPPAPRNRSGMLMACSLRAINVDKLIPAALLICALAFASAVDPDSVVPEQEAEVLLGSTQGASPYPPKSSSPRGSNGFVADNQMTPKPPPTGYTLVGCGDCDYEYTQVHCRDCMSKPGATKAICGNDKVCSKPGWHRLQTGLTGCAELCSKDPNCGYFSYGEKSWDYGNTHKWGPGRGLGCRLGNKPNGVCPNSITRYCSSGYFSKAKSRYSNSWFKDSGCSSSSCDNACKSGHWCGPINYWGGGIYKKDSNTQNPANTYGSPPVAKKTDAGYDGGCHVAGHPAIRSRCRFGVRNRGP